MKQTVYTVYWLSKRDNIKRRHASFKSEEEAKRAIQAWWDIQKDRYTAEIERTNTGALEIAYIDDNYFYRIEEETISEELPSTSYRLKTAGEIESKRQAMQLDEDAFLFDELPEVYRDLLMMAMADVRAARSYTYAKDGKPIRYYRTDH